MASFDFGSVNSDVLGLILAFVLAGAQKIWRGYQERRTETWPIAYGRIDRVTLDTEHKRSHGNAITRTGSDKRTLSDRFGGILKILTKRRSGRRRFRRSRLQSVTTQRIRRAHSCASPIWNRLSDPLRQSCGFTLRIYPRG
jgi:hypothetical protein